ncbi:CTP pyrophosphohydrolase [anaerobic digester metagenome]
MTEVVAALLCRENRFLICQRPAHKKRGLLWEFVGGKREAGENQAEALIRECFEELGIEIKVGKIYMEVTHAYPDITIKLTLLRGEIIQGEPQLLEHMDFRWITVEQIPEYTFCPADEVILTRLMEFGLQES